MNSGRQDLRFLLGPLGHWTPNLRTTSLQVSQNPLDLLQRRLQVLGDLVSEHVGVKQAGRSFQALIRACLAYARERLSEERIYRAPG